MRQRRISPRRLNATMSRSLKGLNEIYVVKT